MGGFVTRLTPPSVHALITCEPESKRGIQPMPRHLYRTTRPHPMDGSLTRPFGPMGESPFARKEQPPRPCTHGPLTLQVSRLGTDAARSYPLARAYALTRILESVFFHLTDRWALLGGHPVHQMDWAKAQPLPGLYRTAFFSPRLRCLSHDGLTLTRNRVRIKAVACIAHARGVTRENRVVFPPLRVFDVS